MATLVTTPFGAAAIAHLAEAVGAAKGGDPLAPVVVVVPTDRVGVAARRGLARAGVGGRTGVAGISILTLRRLAESIATSALTTGRGVVSTGVDPATGPVEAEPASGGVQAGRGRMPVTRPVLVAALSRILRDAPGEFAAVADHPDTARELARAHEHLRLLGPEALDQVAGSSIVAADVVRLHRLVVRTLESGSYDEVDLLTRAAAMVRSGEVPTPPVVLFLPEEVDPPQSDFVRALAVGNTVVAIVGVSGAERADRRVLGMWRGLLGQSGASGSVGTGAQWSGDPTDSSRPAAGTEDVRESPVGDAVLAATDSDDEVRGVVRIVVDRLAQGTPGHRIVVLYGAREPYARLLAEHFAQAGVTINGRGVRPTSERIYGRAVRRLLSLPVVEFRRDEVMSLLADAPIRWRDAPAPATRWERRSRRAGVVRGSDWSVRLADHAATLRNGASPDSARPSVPLDQSPGGDAARGQVPGSEPTSAPSPGVSSGSMDEPKVAVSAGGAAGSSPQGWREESAAEAEDLAEFAADLMTRLSQLADAGTWGAAKQVMLGIWTEVLGAADLNRLPEEERRAADTIDRAIRGLPTLDEIGAPYSLDALRDLLDLELDADLDRVGRSGVGVHVGPVSDGVGLDVDLVIVVGMAEGLLPPRPADDPLLPDAARELTEGVLPTLRERIEQQHRQFLAALAAAPGAGGVAPGGGGGRPSRILTFPRGDMRRSGVRIPSRWLVPTLAALGGSPRLVASQWESVKAVHVHQSHAASVLAADVPASDQEWRQRALAAAGDRRGSEGRGASAALAAVGARTGRNVRGAAEGLLDDAATLRGQQMRAARRSGRFTRFDGLVGPAASLESIAAGRLSATALESWVRCPHRFLVERVLGVAEVEDPEEILSISAMDRGTVLHNTLDELLKEAIREATVPRDGAPWTQHHEQRLMALADDEFGRVEKEGRVGLSKHWEFTSRTLREDLRAFLAEDNTRRARAGLTPLASELTFGRGAVEPIQVPLGDDRVLTIGGSIDRVDEGPAGLVVIDYKSGKPDSFKGVTAADPTLRGRFLQLPLYALAARQVLGRPDAAVEVAYWFITRRCGFALVGYPVSEDTLTAIREVLTTAVEGIAAGHFPPRPNDHSKGYGCPYCDPDGLGDRPGVIRFEELLAADELAAYSRVILGPDAGSEKSA